MARGGHSPIDAPPPPLKPIDPHVIVLFGVTGDLSRRKLLPGLYHLYADRAPARVQDRRLLPRRGHRRGAAQLAREAADDCGHDEPTDEEWAPFAERLASVDITAGPEALAAAVGEQRVQARATMRGSSTT